MHPSASGPSLRTPRPGAGRVLTALLLLATPAWAHETAGQAGGFTNGFSHPWSGWDHVVAMLAVGLWGAQLGAPAIWLLPVAFPMVMAIGGFLGLIGIPLPGIEVGIACSAIFLGAAVALQWRPHLAIACIAVGIFGLFHGHAHGTELPAGANGLHYSLGFVIATGTLHGLGISLGLLHRWQWGAMAMRVTGGTIGIAGLIFLREALA